MNHGSLTPVKYSQSTGVMSILFSYSKSCKRPVKLFIQGLQENKANLDELKKSISCCAEPYWSRVGNIDELNIVAFVMDQFV